MNIFNAAAGPTHSMCYYVHWTYFLMISNIVQSFLPLAIHINYHQNIFLALPNAKMNGENVVIDVCIELSSIWSPHLDPSMLHSIYLQRVDNKMPWWWWRMKKTCSISNTNTELDVDVTEALNGERGKNRHEAMTQASNNCPKEMSITIKHILSDEIEWWKCETKQWHKEKAHVHLISGWKCETNTVVFAQ